MKGKIHVQKTNSKIMYKIALQNAAAYRNQSIWIPGHGSVNPAELVMQICSATKFEIQDRGKGRILANVQYYGSGKQFATNCARCLDDIAISINVSAQPKPYRPTIFYYGYEPMDICTENRRLVYSIQRKMQSANNNYHVYANNSASPNLYYLLHHGVNAIDINLGSILWPDDAVHIVKYQGTYSSAIARGILDYIEQKELAEEVGFCASK